MNIERFLKYGQIRIGMTGCVLSAAFMPPKKGMQIFLVNSQCGYQHLLALLEATIDNDKDLLLELGQNNKYLDEKSMTQVDRFLRETFVNIFSPTRDDGRFAMTARRNRAENLGDIPGEYELTILNHQISIGLEELASKKDSFKILY